jgi:hypothetical protein
VFNTTQAALVEQYVLEGVRAASSSARHRSLIAMPPQDAELVGRRGVFMFVRVRRGYKMSFFADWFRGKTEEEAGAVPAAAYLEAKGRFAEAGSPLPAGLKLPLPDAEDEAQAAMSADVDAIVKRLDEGIPQLNARLDELLERQRRPLAV